MFTLSFDDSEQKKCSQYGFVNQYLQKPLTQQKLQKLSEKSGSNSPPASDNSH